MVANGLPVGNKANLSGKNMNVKNNPDGSVTASVPVGNVKVNGNSVAPVVNVASPAAEVNTTAKNQGQTNLNVKSTNGPLLVNNKPVAPEGVNVPVQANNAKVTPSMNGGANISAPSGVNVNGQNMGQKVNVSSEKGNVKVTKTPVEKIINAQYLILRYALNQQKRV